MVHDAKCGAPSLVEMGLGSSPAPKSPIGSRTAMPFDRSRGTTERGPGTGTDNCARNTRCRATFIGNENLQQPKIVAE
jgi:hypothetical protein